MRRFSSQRGLDAWSEDQLQALATLQREHGGQPIGDAFSSNILRADGSFSADLGEMRLHHADAYTIARLINEHRWVFVLDADGFLIDVLAATADAMDDAGTVAP